MSFLALLASATLQLPLKSNPKVESRLRPHELIRLYKVGGKTDYGTYRNLLILRDDHMVINKAWNRTLWMKLNPAQWDDYKAVMQYLDWKWFHKLKKGKPRAGRTEFYLSVRQNGKIHRWSSIGLAEPWPMPIFDTLDVWEYLCKDDERKAGG